MKARIKWVEDRTFIGESGSGHKIVLGTAFGPEGRTPGPSPMELVLIGLGGCSGYDVVHILEKSRQAIEDVTVELEAERAQQDPKVFSRIHMHFVVKGRGLTAEKVERAIALSVEKYCSASAMIAKTASIIHDFEIVDTAARGAGTPDASTAMASDEALKHTPLHALYLELGARMVPFAGYEMPVQYRLGVLKEHLHTRKAAGLFDVSHMGQIVVRAKSGDARDAAHALERLVPVDIAGLPPGSLRYAFFTNAHGGILDDLMVANRGDDLLIIVNAACKAADEEHLRAQIGKECEIERLDRALIALQGPRAESALAVLAPGCTKMRFMDVRTLTLMGAECTVMRSGYTREDGFEISTSAAMAREVAEELLANADVAPIGLGARDTLRLEAGLCLYGADIDENTTPVEADLSWAIQKVRRYGGAREGGFPGAEIILGQLEHGAPRRRIGLRPEGGAPVRAGAPLYAEMDANTPVGSVTSGGFGPSLDAPIAMGYLPAALAAPATGVFAELRGKRLPVAVTTLPFVAPKYKRG